jgi:hypothetical protein
MSSAPKSMMIMPNVQAPRTLGILCIIFASYLLLCDSCTGFFAAFGTVFAKAMDINFRGMQAQIDSGYKSEVRTYEKREAAAKTEEDKERVRKERKDFESKPRPVITTGLPQNIDQLRDPTLSAFNWVSLGTGMLLNSLMLAGGLGLIALSEPGRRLSIWVAGLKIARLALLTAFTFGVIIPKTVEIQRGQFKRIQVEQKAAMGKAAAGGPDFGVLETVAVASSYATWGGYFLLAPIFPIVLLVALNRPRVRAAFYRPKSRPEVELP